MCTYCHLCVGLLSIAIPMQMEGPNVVSGSDDSMPDTRPLNLSPRKPTGQRPPARSPDAVVSQEAPSKAAPRSKQAAEAESAASPHEEAKPPTHFNVAAGMLSVHCMAVLLQFCSSGVLKF